MQLLKGIEKYGSVSNGKMSGSIRYFDALSGKGVVRGDDGKSYNLHFASIKGVDKNNYQWPSDKDKVRLKKIDGKSASFDVSGIDAINVEIQGL